MAACQPMVLLASPVTSIFKVSLVSSADTATDHVEAGATENSGVPAPESPTSTVLLDRSRRIKPLMSQEAQSPTVPAAPADW